MVNPYVIFRVVDLPVEQSSNSSQSSEEEEEGEEEGIEEGVDPSEEALIQAFGETAVQGVTWLVHAMGLNVNQSNNAAATGATGQQPPAAAQQQSAVVTPTATVNWSGLGVFRSRSAGGLGFGKHRDHLPTRRSQT